MEETLRAELTAITTKLSDQGVMSSREGQALMRRQAELRETLELFDKQHALSAEISQTTDLQADPELAELAAQDLAKLRAEQAAIELRLEETLRPKDPNDRKNAIVEIRAGAGGDEEEVKKGKRDA